MMMLSNSNSKPRISVTRANRANPNLLPPASRLSFRVRVNSFVCKFPEAYAETLELLNGHYARVKQKYGLQPDEGIVLEDRNDHFLQNPLKANTKGRGRRGSTKHQIKRKRRRGHCGLCGIVGHNKQTCTGLTNRRKQLDESGSTDDDDDDDDNDDYRGPNH
ncbi:unnamed protein product [Trifolium pratense]|uniref:Uncharacterized protein n=1 Tax=Trifolium pratense TaxID=57577 RepID=A0ACB0K8X4_TRIPR|nr:unnamed protein product [Trifolium pratense]